MGINDIVKSMFDGYKGAKTESYYPRRFQEMAKTNILFDLDETADMLKHAEDKEQFDTILDHLYRFDATRVKGYEKIEKKIIHKYWEE